MIKPDKNFTLDKDHFRSFQSYVQRMQRSIVNDIPRLFMTRKERLKTNPVKTNQMVLVKNNRVEPVCWKLEKIHELLTVKSGTTREVEIIRLAYAANENYSNSLDSSIKED